MYGGRDHVRIGDVVEFENAMWIVLNSSALKLGMRIRIARWSSGRIIYDDTLYPPISSVNLIAHPSDLSPAIKRELETEFYEEFFVDDFIFVKAVADFFGEEVRDVSGVFAGVGAGDGCEDCPDVSGIEEQEFVPEIRLQTAGKVVDALFPHVDVNGDYHVLDLADMFLSRREAKCREEDSGFFVYGPALVESSFSSSSSSSSHSSSSSPPERKRYTIATIVDIVSRNFERYRTVNVINLKLCGLDSADLWHVIELINAVKDPRKEDSLPDSIILDLSWSEIEPMGKTELFSDYPLTRILQSDIISYVDIRGSPASRHMNERWLSSLSSGCLEKLIWFSQNFLDHESNWLPLIDMKGVSSADSLEERKEAVVRAHTSYFEIKW